MTIGPFLPSPPSPTTFEVPTVDSMKYSLTLSLTSPPYSPASSPISSLFGLKGEKFDHHHHRHRHQTVIDDHSYSHSLKDSNSWKFSDRLEDHYSDWLNKLVVNTDTFSDKTTIDAIKDNALLQVAESQLTPPQTPTYSANTTTGPQQTAPSSQHGDGYNHDLENDKTKAPTSPPNLVFNFPSEMSHENVHDTSHNLMPGSNDVESAVVSANHSKPATKDDALLSSSLVLDRRTSCDNVLDTDFLQELDDLDFGFDEFDPCLDVKMDADSFQEFIESTLDDAFPEEFDDICGSFANDDTTGSSCANDIHNSDCVFRRYRRNSSSSGNEPVIVDQAGFMEVLGLRPSAIAPTRANHRSLSSSCCACVQNAASPQSANNSCHSCDLIPTKLCSCLYSGSHSHPVYTTASSPPKDNHNVATSTRISSETTTSSSNDNRLSNPDLSDRSCTKIKLDPSMGLLPPLSIDTYNYGVLSPTPSAYQHRLELRNSQQEVDELFGLLSSDTQENSYKNTDSASRCDFNVPSMDTNSSSLTSVLSESSGKLCEIDLESFKDLGDLLDDSLCEDMDTTEQSLTDDVNHDHTYQKSIQLNSEKTNISNLSEFQHESSLGLSTTSALLSTNNGFQNTCSAFHYDPDDDLSSFYDDESKTTSMKVAQSEDIPSLTQSQHLENPALNSSLSHSPSMSFSPNSDFFMMSDISQQPMGEKNQLELLHLFSDETAPSLLYQESTVQHFRFV